MLEQWQTSALKRQMETISGQCGPATRRVADFIMKKPDEVIHLSITELAEITRSSEATIVRLCQLLNHKGYQSFKISLSRSLAPTIRTLHEDITLEDTPEEIADKIFRTTVQTMEETRSVLCGDSLACAIEILSRSGRIECVGFGSSSAIALDAHQKFMKLGKAGSAYSDPHNASICAASLGPDDCLFVISYSGTTSDVLYIAGTAKEVGAKVVAVTRFGRSPLVRIADVCLFTSSPESRFRSEGIASRIAQLAVIDSLYVGLFIAQYPKTKEVLEMGRKAVMPKHGG